MPLQVGFNKCQHEPKVGALRVKIIHPKSWTETKFHKNACKKEKICPRFITYLLDGERKELDVANLSISKTHNKLKTFSYLK
jgi:hypothetical protein